MNSTLRRITAFAVGGATAGAVHAIIASPNWRILLLSLVIGFVSGAVAGVIASISAPKFLQGVLTGTAAGLSVGVLSFYLLGSDKTFVIYVTSQIIALAAGALAFRYLIGSSGQSLLFAPPPCKKALDETM
jgi:hypothetical protein